MTVKIHTIFEIEAHVLHNFARCFSLFFSLCVLVTKRITKICIKISKNGYFYFTSYICLSLEKNLMCSCFHNTGLKQLYRPVVTDILLQQSASSGYVAVVYQKGCVGCSGYRYCFKLIKSTSIYRALYKPTWVT